MDRTWGFVSLISVLFVSLNYSTLFSHAANTISLGQSIKDGDVLLSSNGSFQLGFFSPENSTVRYVGIWYNISTQSIVWVANRDNPIYDKNGVFKIDGYGNLVILDGNGTSVWVSDNSTVWRNTTAILMDTGNLILSNSDYIGDVSRAYWQSFKFPTDTYLPGMKVLVDTSIGDNRAFRSWKSDTDPSTGNFDMGIDPRGSPQIVIWNNSSSIRRWRSGQWNGLIFIGIPTMTSNYQYGFKLSTDDDDGKTYFTYTPNDNSYILNFRIRSDGIEEQKKWNETKNGWNVMQYQPADQCEFYNTCGNYSICDIIISPICTCFNGFEARDLNQWNRGNWSGGCVRKTELQCLSNSSESDGFLEVKNVKLPDFADLISTVDIGDCKDWCLGNCSCKAYAYVGGIGCMVWSDDLVDIEQFSENGKSLFLRLAHSEILEASSSRLSAIVIAAIVVSVTFAIIFLIWLFYSRRTKLKGCSDSLWNNPDVPINDPHKSRENSKEFSGQTDISGERKPGNVPELPIYSFQCVSDATSDFSNANKLGQGGFGPVYKGKFPGGQEIAVKRLSRKSGQGDDEFKNEIILIAKLQHRNLVRLLGCCIEGEEKMLLYEYMPNKSLDSFLFDTTKQAQLDWVKRFAIIEGIARGLLYLHRDSRLTIIHRDLKASNILLDEDMNPKISDFGLARIFAGNQNEEANTLRVVGTYGYMSPEYAMEGLFSVKSDVYSFGVLLLEIISSRRNTSFRLSGNANLIKHAWSLWNEGNAKELIDTTIVNSCCMNEVLRCIHVGMLCIQDLAARRPNMSTVVLMLESETASLPNPRQTSITSMGSSIDTDTWNEGRDIVSSNEITISVVTAR